jgi:hypothetical protein|uniref:Uncharacterized protein n=1 Tax=viral metagenome TaxID=1070528 RepID=A0A6C0D3U6_9ZZZZ
MDPRILYSLESAIIFFIIASPFMYSVTSPITKLVKIGAYGPLLVHSLVFGLIVYLLMVLH